VSRTNIGTELAFSHPDAQLCDKLEGGAQITLEFKGIVIIARITLSVTVMGSTMVV
jgi:hypothetical protein